MMGLLGVRLWASLTLPVAFMFAGSAAAVSAAPPALDIVTYDLAANQDRPAICFILSQTVARPPGAPLEAYVAVDPAVKITATPRNDRLCLDGFAFGVAYAITLKAGLPGVSGVLAKDSQFRIVVPDRPPELGFAAPTAEILPRLGSGGLPIRSVNVPRIAVEAFRIADRNLLRDAPPSPLAGTDLPGFAPARGEFVWRGVVTPKGEANRDAVTLLPLDTTIGALKPGVYVAVAWPDGAPENAPTPLATQYFQVSDFGLTAYRGADSLLVSVRSLSTAAAAPGVDVAVIAENNRELGRARSDDSGFARVDPALLRGAGGDRPAEIYAYGDNGEFSRLALPQAMIPADGAADPPAAAEARIDLPRRDYHPGDTVTASILLRTSQGIAVQKAPLTVKIVRPDGAPFDTRALSDQGAGGYAFAFALPDRNAVGEWRIEAYQGGGRDMAGSARFAVAAPPASALTMSLTADAAVFDTAQPGMVAIESQYPGGVAPNLPGDLQVALQTADDPFPGFPGFAFGLAGERISPVRTDPVRFVTDAAGRADLPLKPGPAPRATRPLKAHITARMFDAAGRTIERSLDLPVSDRALLLGIRPVGGTVFSEGQPVRFEAIAVSPDGARQDKPDAGWEILRLDPAPSWRWDGTRFAYRPILADSHVAGGAVDIPAATAAEITANLPAGRYRIELFDPKGEAISSVEFSVGSADLSVADDAGAVEIRPSKPAYAAGESAEIFVKPPFDAQVVLVPAGRDAGDGIVQHIPAAGATMRFEFPHDVANGLHVLATAIAPPASAGGAPLRARGSAWLAADPAPRRLDVALDLPDKTPPGQKLAIPVTVSGAGAEPAFVSVTAVGAAADREAPEDNDDSATDPPPPSVAVYDVYDDVITPVGRVVSADGPMIAPGGAAHGDQRANDAPRRAEERIAADDHAFSVASGVTALDKSGKGVATLTIPDVTGRLRVRAVAWSAAKQGDAERTLAVRQPLSVELPLPGFMTRDDRADLFLALDNRDGPRGEYRIRVDGDGVAILDSVVNLAEHEQRTFPVTLAAKGPGPMAVVISVKGPGGIAFDRHLAVAVRPGGQRVWRHASAILKPGATLTVDPALTAGLRPDSPAFSLLAATAATFDPVILARELRAASAETLDQIIGAATPDLWAAGVHGPGGDDPAGAVRRLSGWQNRDGGFAAAFSSGSDLWTTAMAAEFLGRVKAAGAPGRDGLPADVMLARALDYLALRAIPLSASGDPAAPPQSIEAAAYARKVLAANGRQNLFQLRYFASQFLPAAHAPLADALIGAAYAALGDKDAAGAAFTAAASAESAPAESAPDLRDQAALAAVMAESGAAPQKLLEAMAEKIADATLSRRRFSTQESIWLYRAAAALPAPAGDIRLKVGDQTISEAGAFTLATKAGDSGLPAIRNAAGAPVRIDLAVEGIIAADSRDSAGYEAQRWFFDPTGKPVDPANLRQNDRLIVVLTGRFTGQGPARPVLTDELPGGWGIEAAQLTDPADRFPWLKDLTGAVGAAAEDGRYVAAPILAGERREFKLAYVVRAATRGQFSLPGAVVEDIDQPSLLARIPAGRTRIDPPT